MVAAIGSITHQQLMSALDLSRAGADIQAQVLADAGLVLLVDAGRIVLEQERLGNAPASGALGRAVANFDDSMATSDEFPAKILS